MWKYKLFYITVFCSKVFLTGGDVWPKPQHEEKGMEVYVLDPAAFEIQAMDHVCIHLWKAMLRYEKIINDYEDLEYQHLTKSLHLFDSIQELRIYLSQPCESYPQADMNEHYNLTVSKISELRSDSVWGILRGLETFAQLFELDHSNYRVKTICATKIRDFPRYPHRGFLIDTARHYLSPAFIMSHLDTMAMNKFNVLHWHITDSQSFPYQSEALPEMSKKGAFAGNKVYDKKAIREIVDFAAERGIRVIPEIDMPAHSKSWGLSHPEVLVDCTCGSGLLNPSTNATFHLVQQLMAEMLALFPDRHVHLGGDEVMLDCCNFTSTAERISKGVFSHGHWRDNIPAKNYTNKQFLNEFYDRVSSYLFDRVPIFWEDVFTQDVSLPENSVIQIWKDFEHKTAAGVVGLMLRTFEAGFRYLYSRMWYLNPMFEATLTTTYQSDPRSILYMNTAVENNTWLEMILGGETCLWSEDVMDESSFVKLAWPRAAAIAEVLWSPRDLAVTPEVPLGRLKEQMTRMRERGIPVPDFKETNTLWKTLMEKLRSMIF